MSHNNKHKLSRREFAGTVAAALAAPALLGALPESKHAQKKQPPPKTKAEAPPPPAAESEEEKALKELRAFAVSEGSEPAFIFRARLR